MSALSPALGALHDSTTGVLSRTMRRDSALLAFILTSLAVTMALRQEVNFERGSIWYWLLIGPAVVLPLTAFSRITRAATQRARPLLLFGVASGGWFLLTGDGRAVFQLGLIVWVGMWMASDEATINANDVARLYVALIILGAVLVATSDINAWGLLPGKTHPDFNIWRVSFFPNVANTGILSLAVIMVLTRYRRLASRHPIALALAAYFLAFSFVRTAIIGVALYFSLLWWFARRPRTSRALFWTSLIASIGANVMIATWAALVVGRFQNVPIVSRLFLQGASGLTPEQILAQMYRPILWGQHLELFATSPMLMGWGSADFTEIAWSDLLPAYIGSGSESFPTRLLATYGAPALFFIWYLVDGLRRSARAGDVWACACFPVVFLLMMNWGSVFHPTSAFFVIFLLMVTSGSRAFDDQMSPPKHATSTDPDGSAGVSVPV